MRSLRLPVFVLAWSIVACPTVPVRAADAPPVESVDSIGLRLVRIPAGEFRMGCLEPAEKVSEVFAAHRRKPEYFADEFPAHRVRITRPFLMGKHEITVGQFRRFCEETGYRTEGETDGEGGWGYDPKLGKCTGRRPEFTWKNPGFEQTDRHPVLNVSWNDAVAFCAWRSKKEQRTYRLPTEAEWEYACRAGSTTRYADGDDPEGLSRRARTLEPTPAILQFAVQDVPIPRDGSIPFTAPVGSFKPNAFGLCDMHGNVWEWTSDWHGDDWYAKSPTDDPRGPEDTGVKVRRGGAWNSFPIWVRSSFRNWNSPDSRCVNLGFRVVVEIPQP